MKELNSLNDEYTNYEEVENDTGKTKKRGFGSFINSYAKRLHANIENKTIRNEAKAVKTQSDSIKRDLEKSFMEEINEIANLSITLSQEDINNIQHEERFKGLSVDKQTEILNLFKKRIEKNKANKLKSEHKDRTEEEIERRKDAYEKKLEEKTNIIREKMEKRIKKAEKTYREAHQKIINGEYEEASMRAEQVLEEIKYQKEFISKLKSFSNSSLFKLKKTSQIFKRQKDIMTTILLANGRDEVLINLEKRAEDIKGISKANMKKQTKELKEDLSRPRNMEQEFIGEREPIYQGKTIVGFKSKRGLDILSIRNVLYRGTKKIYIVQQRKGQMLYGAMSEDGDPLTPTYFTKNYKIEKNKLIYETTENSGKYEEINLE